MSQVRYAYRAADPAGQVRRGTVEADSEEAARRRLQADGLYPLRVALDQSPATVSAGRRISRQDLAILFRSVASLTGAGVPVERALGASTNLVGDTLAAELGRLRTRLREGDTLAVAMAERPDVFPRVVIGLVAAGEQASQLAEALELSADQLEEEARLRSEVRSALAYPLLVLTIGLGSVFVMGGVVVPRFTVLLDSLGADIPLSTRILLRTSEVVREYWWAGIGGAAAVAVACSQAVRRPRVRHHLDRFLLDLPLAGRIRLGFASGRVCRSVGAMVRTGMPLVPALEAAEEGAGDLEVAARIRRARLSVQRGERLRSALEQEEALTPIALQFVGAGEESGDLALMMTRAGEVSQERAHRALHALIRLLEPALVVALGALVALTAAALLQAVYSVRPGG